MNHSTSPGLLLIEAPAEGVAVIRLNRPEVLNALNTALLAELADVLETFSHSEDVRAVVITGNERAFAAGADVREMAHLDAVGVHQDPRPQHWARIAAFNKPLIAAVNGFALGGGCELAMHADIIIAARSASFGQPEINLGIIPGAGGTQRLIRAVGKAAAAMMVLTGEAISADRALQLGLIAEITEPELTLERAIAVARKIAGHAPLAVQQAKDVLNKAWEMTLSSGLQYERRAFTFLAATADRNEGISAFLEKRRPVYRGR
ncbi:2,3-dehydroadipyl-CoA hydratase [Pokkaliibacter plantistimulans]|uniref:2,3-dehydroadipyl-CoA hydratase n=1 Tax=Pokkaliibacter plantistimulans TaxID=1635171 RepID=A0ABX5LYV4_9GAMM|nr:2,3-dehydroadipyl-CoA hydratase PaaF [Pokkaliibacter plantistimulans]PXF31397.1 2,3-dehydroadipyl-CoA hydratase [Pokkaliibacter plantistimulans]